MGAAAGPHIVEEGLDLCIDAENIRSYSGSGGTVKDLVNGNNGAIIGASFKEDNNKRFRVNAGERIGFGIDGGSLDFNPGFNNELTVSAWINPDNPADGRAPIARIDRWYFQVYSQDRLASYWYGRSPSGYHYSNENTIPMNQWSYATVVWTTDSVIFYINGEKDRTIQSVLGTGDRNDYVRIGYENSGREYEGDIGLVQLYNRALSDLEVKQNFQATRSRYGI